MENVPHAGEAASFIQDDPIYRACFEGAPDALLILDRSGRILDVNAQACRLLGYVREEMLSLTIADLSPPDTPPPLNRPQDAEPQTQLRLSTVYRCKDGRWTPVEVNGQRIVTGRRDVWLISVHDISRRKQLEMILAERNTQLASLNQLVQALSQSLDLAQIGRAAVERIRAMTHFDAAGIALLDERNQWLTPVYAVGISEALVARYRTLKRVGAKFATQLSVLGYPLVIDDLHSDVNLPARTRRGLINDGLRAIVMFPITVEGRVEGLLGIARRRLTVIDETTLQLLQSAAGYLGQAMRNARLYVRQQRRAAEQQALVNILGIAISTMQLDEMLPALAESASQMLRAENAFITRWDEDLRCVIPLAANRAANARFISMPEATFEQMSLTRGVIESGKPLPLYDFPNSSFAVPDYAFAFGNRSVLALPLVAHDRRLGALIIGVNTPRRFTPGEIELARTAASLVALAIDNAQLYRREQRRAAEQQALVEILGIASSTLELDEVYQALADNMVRVIGGDQCHITEWDGVAQRPTVVAAYGPPRELYANTVLPAGLESTLTGRVLFAGKPIAIDDVHDSPYSNPQIAALLSTRSRLALPLIADGRKLGAVLIGFKQPRRFTDEEVALASRAADLVAVAVAKAQLHRELRQHARDLESEVADRTQELRTTNERLRSLDRLKTRLITQISHEFRTPLANLKTYTHLLTSGRAEKREQYLGVLNDQVEVLTRLISSVTLFAEADLTPNSQPAPSWPVRDAIHKIAIVYGAEAAAKSIRIDVNDPGADVRVQASPQRVSLALDEIVANAIAYTDAGGRVTIGAEAVSEDGREWVRLSVSDTGIGIPADELPHIFDQFFRGQQRSLQVRGIGMGLSLAQAAAEAEGGRITVESAGVGQGSTFYVWLPLP